MACGGDRLHFNLTHSHELGLCAVARNEELGVDVEWMRPLDDLHALARFVFSAHEYGRFCALHERQKLAAFYSCWTHKEAYLKAGGDGFVIPPDQFDVMPIPGAPSGVAGMGLNRVAPRDWFLQACSPAPGYVGAVAVPGQAWQAEGWQWTEHNAPPSIDL